MRRGWVDAFASSLSCAGDPEIRSGVLLIKRCKISFLGPSRRCLVKVGRIVEKLMEDFTGDEKVCGCRGLCSECWKCHGVGKVSRSEEEKRLIWDNVCCKCVVDRRDEGEGNCFSASDAVEVFGVTAWLCCDCEMVVQFNE